MRIWMAILSLSLSCLGQKRANSAPVQLTDSGRAYWAFAPLRTAFSPNASIDSLIDTKASAAAPPASLVRRLYFDLTGLPPEPSLKSASYESLVDRLLASPHFGERWARHWLDIARFAESHGFEHDSDRRLAFKYRDFVIRAFNQDMPYDRFVRWQLAGDELAPDNPEALIATGFLAAGVHATQITINEAERIRYDEMDDMLATTGSAMLATTIGCARCHDHKYDPIPTRDYYRMLSAFTTTVRSEVRTRAGEEAMVCSEGTHLLPMRLHKSNEHRIPDFYEQTFTLTRGDTNQKAATADLGFLQALTRDGGNQAWMSKRSKDPRTSGRRTSLAYWITDTGAGAGHLLARVIVNRIWQHYFGRGIVATPNDFGSQGERPTNPELLDWLASELIRNGWRLKSIHRLILMSDAYRAPRPPRRLEAEAIRDNALAVSGMLDKTMYGPGTLDESMQRRSIYFTVKRSQLVPSMQLFDWPDTLTSQEARAVTTTASQALVFLNDPQFRRMAEGFAARIRNEKDSIGAAYGIAYGRPPTTTERSLSREFLANGGLADLCAALMNANEFIYID